MKKDIFEIINRDSGERIPEAYLTEFSQRIKASLPELDFANDNADKGVSIGRSLWQKSRPYLYMAAMFAGIWCMLNLFNLGKNTDTDLSNDSQLIAAVNNDAFMSDYILPEVDLYDLYDELYSSGFDPSEIMDENEGKRSASTGLSHS